MKTPNVDIGIMTSIALPVDGQRMVVL